MVNKKEEILWKKTVAPYRHNIDMATLFWMWKRFVPDFNPFEKLEEIVAFFPQDNLFYVKPRGLFGNILGGGKMSFGEVVSAEDILLTELGMRSCFPNDKDRFLFNETAWRRAVDVSLNSRRPCQNFDLTWMLRYRRDISIITPFSDYQLIRSGNEAYLSFLENGFVQDMDDIASMGVSSVGSEIELLKELTPKGIYKKNSIVGDVAYTHSFLNLDDFVGACDQIGYEIPDIFRSPLSNRSLARDKFREVDFDIRFEKEDEFKLLAVAERVQEYLKYDLDGIRLLNSQDVSKIKVALREKINKSLGSQDDTLVDHIWILIMPVSGEFKRHKGKKLIRSNISAVVERLWHGDTFQTWRKDSAADRLGMLKSMGYGTNEAKALKALLTPESMQVTGKPSKVEIERYRDQILSKDFSWLGQPFP